MKDYREKELKMYILACVLLLICLTRGYSLQMETGEKIVAISTVIDTSLASGCIYMFVYISDALFSSEIKDKIVSLFGLIKKPAYSVFSNIEKNDLDDRFLKDEVTKPYKDIYVNMPEDEKQADLYQNANWYKIYSKNRDVSMIYSSNRDYLLCRDMFISTISLLVIYMLSIVVKLFEFNIIYVLFLVAMLFVNLWTTHIKAKRFVYNVIAYDLTHRDDKYGEGA